MSVNIEVDVKKNANYWIYIMSKKLWDQYMRSTESSDDDNLFISSYDKTDIKKGDVIFYYLKNGRNSGFTGLCRVCTAHKENKQKIKIFNDRNLNEHLIKLDYLTFFETPISLKDVLGTIKADKVGHRSEGSFRSKYLKDNALFVRVNAKGNKLMKELFRISEEQLESEESEESEESDESYESSNSANAKNKYEEISSNSVFLNNKKGKHNQKKNKINIIDDEYSDATNNAKNDAKSDADESESSEADGEIPIMIIPCKEFKWPKKKSKQKNYFIKHYKECKVCEVNDNNNINIGQIIDNAHIEYYISTKTDDIYFEIPVEDYHDLKYHEPDDMPDNIKGNPFIRIVRIDNGDEIYHGCILITWTL